LQLDCQNKRNPGNPGPREEKSQLFFTIRLFVVTENVDDAGFVVFFAAIGTGVFLIVTENVDDATVVFTASHVIGLLLVTENVDNAVVFLLLVFPARLASSVLFFH
jgi:hypothetical protein